MIVAVVAVETGRLFCYCMRVWGGGNDVGMEMEMGWERFGARSKLPSDELSSVHDILVTPYA